jgi:hypothetical protein
VVALKGSLRVNPSERFPFIEVRPARGNVWGYRAISAFCCMQPIAHMKQNHPVDAGSIGTTNDCVQRLLPHGSSGASAVKREM